MAGLTTARGYGWRHQRVRAAWRPRVDAGLVDCARCGEPIVPGEPWDLGHDDVDRSRYQGPEHRACNRSAGAGRRRPTREEALAVWAARENEYWESVARERQAAAAAARREPRIYY
jgi:hypothetical protein